MPFQKDPRIPELTPEQRAEEVRAREDIQRRRPVPNPATSVRPRDVRVMLNLVGSLRKAREAQGMTLAQLAERTGIDEPNLSRLETGKTLNPTVVTLFRVAAALGKDLMIALTDTEPARPVDGKQGATSATGTVR
jgi:ribosome-binding protein aMBF1 (putative translation factor)